MLNCNGIIHNFKDLSKLPLQPQIILASGSPRRKELLEQIGLKFKVHPSNFEEKETHLTPEKLALHNAIGKAEEIAKLYKNAIVIGVDTVVSYKNHLLNKPKNEQDHKRMLKILSGKTQKVISAICLIDTRTNKKLTSTETTKVKMDRLTPEFIKAYIDSGEGLDKAGGYAIQGKGSLFIKAIEGDYFNVVGLPLNKLRKMFEKIGLQIF